MDYGRTTSLAVGLMILVDRTQFYTPGAQLLTESESEGLFVYGVPTGLLTSAVRQHLGELGWEHREGHTDAWFFRL